MNRDEASRRNDASRQAQSRVETLKKLGASQLLQSSQTTYPDGELPRAMIACEKTNLFRFVSANASAAALFDMEMPHIAGKAVQALFEEPIAELWQKNLEALVIKGMPVTFRVMTKTHGVATFQNFILSKTGDAGLIEVIAIPPTTDSAISQKEREESVFYLTSLFDASGLAVVVTDQRGLIMRTNDAFLRDFGWTGDETVGFEFIRLLATSDIELSRRLYKAFIERGKHGSREAQIKSKTGEIIDAVITSTLLDIGDGRRYMISTIRDVTEKKNMIRRLRAAKEGADEANRAKSAFLCNMSHELRTPLNAIIGFSEIIKNEMFGPIQNKKYDEYLKDIHFSARHLLDIINDILDMSKIEAGKIDLFESIVAVPDVIHSVSRIMEQRARAAYVNIDFDLPADLPRLRVDHRLFRQILINLLSNAVKFSTPGSRVLVSAQRIAHDGRIKVVVQDSGCGIPSAKLPLVLEPFGQAYDAKQYGISQQGTGLGLAIAKAMMDLHQGRLTLESSEGEGTTVTLDFPANRSVDAI